MKQFLSILLLFGFTCLSANATSQVFYTNTGLPSSATYGGTYNKSINNFGQNAGFTPANVQKREAIERAQKHEDQYYNGLEKGRNVNVNINTTIHNNTPNATGTENNETKITTHNKSQTEMTTKKRRFVKQETTVKNGIKYYNN